MNVAPHRRADTQWNRMQTIWLLGGLLGVAAVASEVNASGTQWSIEFRAHIQADGTLTFIFDLDQGTEKTVAFAVEDGTSDVLKAENLATLLDDQYELQAFQGSGDDNKTVYVQVDDSWTYDDSIVGMSLEDTGTGEDVHYQKDDPSASGTIIVRLVLEISGQGTGGRFALGIGDDPNPLVSVATLNKSGDEVLAELIDKFNIDYSGLYVAQGVGGTLIVQNVPCPLGARYGTDDTGLGYTFTMAQTDVIPAVSEWGLILMAVVVLSAGAFILRRRTRGHRMPA